MTCLPPHLRQCIVLFVVAEVWLLLDIGWFVLFMLIICTCFTFLQQQMYSQYNSTWISRHAMLASTVQLTANALTALPSWTHRCLGAFADTCAEGAFPWLLKYLDFLVTIKIFQLIFQYVVSATRIINYCLFGENGRDLTQSYDKIPNTNGKLKKGKRQHKNTIKMFRLHSDCGPI